MKLRTMSNRSGSTRGILSNSKEIDVYDSENKLVRSFGSATELQTKAKKYLGVTITRNQIRIYCKTQRLFQGKYYLKLKDFIF